MIENLFIIILAGSSNGIVLALGQGTDRLISVLDFLLYLMFSISIIHIV